jgi:hypothetical protein
MVKKTGGNMNDQIKSQLLNDLNLLRNAFAHPKDEWSEKKEKKLNKAFYELQASSQNIGGEFYIDFEKYSPGFQLFLKEHNNIEDKKIQEYQLQFSKLQDDLRKS